MRPVTPFILSPGTYVLVSLNTAPGATPNEGNGNNPGLGLPRTVNSGGGLISIPPSSGNINAYGGVTLGIPPNPDNGAGKNYLHATFEFQPMMMPTE